MIEKKKIKKNIHFKSSKYYKNGSKTWDKDNQAWWDWYVTLADNSNSSTKNTLLELPEPPKIKDSSTIDIKQELTKPYNLTTNDIKTFLDLPDMNWKYTLKNTLQSMIQNK